MRSKRHQTSVVLFMMCAALPEDATVGAAVFDALEGPFSRLVEADAERRRKKRASRAGGDAPPAEAAEKAEKKAVRPRRCLKLLLDHSLLQV